MNTQIAGLQIDGSKSNLVFYGLMDQSTWDPLGNQEGEILRFDSFGSAVNLSVDTSKPNQEVDDDELYPVSVIEIRKERALKICSKVLQWRNDWVKIELQHKGGRSDVSMMLVPEAFQGYVVVSIKKLASKIVASLEKMMNSIWPSSRTNIGVILRKALRGAESLHVSTVDVGQGGLVALHSIAESPCLFFDLGWPTSYLRSSAPANLPSLVDIDAPVVLSHWDWDHWGLALGNNIPSYNKSNGCWKIIWNQPAISRAWVVPGTGVDWGGVRIRPLHWRLALALRRNGYLHRWPSATAWNVKHYKNISIYRTRGGDHGDKNQHGLVMVVHNHTDISTSNDGPRIPAILLPGDADYKNIPFLKNASEKGFDVNPFEFLGLVATHHGARYTRAYTPVAAIGARLAISVGRGNGYPHPKPIAQAGHLRKGWMHQALTMNRVSSFYQELCDCSRGNVGLTTKKSLYLDWCCSKVGSCWFARQ